MDVVEWLRLRQTDVKPFGPEDIKATLSEIEWLRTTVARLTEERDLGRAAITARDKEIRRLRVGDGPTFDELRAAGKIGGGSPYRFEELLDVSQTAPTPPLIFIHAPRTGGHTLNSMLMRNYKIRAISRGGNFFPRYFPTEFLSWVQPPETEDDRDRPAFFGGHINLANDIFRYMPVRYVVATILRNPVDRIVSHYRFNSTKPSVFRDAIRDEGLDVVGYLRRLGAAIPQQYELFSPGSTKTGGARVAEALSNLETSMSLFGLQEDYDALPSMLHTLLGLPDLSRKRLNVLPPGAVEVTTEQAHQLRDFLETDIAFYDGAVALYRRRLEMLAKRPPPKPHPWTPYYA